MKAKQRPCGRWYQKQVKLGSLKDGEEFSLSKSYMAATYSVDKKSSRKSVYPWIVIYTSVNSHRTFERSKETVVLVWRRKMK